MIQLEEINPSQIPAGVGHGSFSVIHSIGQEKNVQTRKTTVFVTSFVLNADFSRLQLSQRYARTSPVSVSSICLSGPWQTEHSVSAFSSTVVMSNSPIFHMYYCVEPAYLCYAVAQKHTPTHQTIPCSIPTKHTPSHSGGESLGQLLATHQLQEAR